MVEHHLAALEIGVRAVSAAPNDPHVDLDRMAAGATRSYAGTKRQLNKWLYEHMDAQLEFEAGIQKEMAASGDFAEGLAAFAEKRPPRFSGA